jgi:hypothetical protein
MKCRNISLEVHFYMEDPFLLLIVEAQRKVPTQGARPGFEPGTCGLAC